MRNFVFTLGSLLLTLALGACAAREAAPSAPFPAATDSTTATVDVGIGLEWVAFAIDGVEEVLSPKPRLRWLTTEQISGTGGCNAFVGRSSLGQDRLHLGPLTPTKSSCLTLPGTQEDLFFKALEGTRKARVESGQFVLMDGSGRILARFRKSE
jgi:heat shock protein HslJ